MARALVAALVAVLAGGAVGYKSPNIVFFLADDIGWSDFGYFGYDLVDATPTIDTLAEQGVKLACVYGQTACTPGRAAFLTGRYPIRTGLQGGAIKATQRKGIFMSFSLVSDELKKAGYATAMVGKWHVGCAAWEQTPTYRGFDTFYGFIANGQMDFLTKMNDGYYDLYDDANYETDSYALSSDVRTSDLYDARAEDFIRSQSTSQPWFLYYAFQDPHTPLTSPEYFLEQYPCSAMSDSSRQVYCGMMRCIDTAVEGVMAAVQEAGFIDNTLVVFSGDNGGAPKNGGYNWPLRGSKGTLFEGGVRQASWAWGAMIDSSVWGTTYHGALSLTDFFPTFLSVATAGKWQPSSGETLDGVDNWLAISTGSASARSETLINAYGSSGAIRVGDYKLMYNCKSDDWYQQPSLNANTAANASSPYVAALFPSVQPSAVHAARTIMAGGGGGGGGDSTTYMLFNVADDPYEYTDLAETYPEIVEELMEKLSVYISEQVDPDTDSDKEDEAKSKAAQTGYWGPWLDSLSTSAEGHADSNVKEE